MRNHEIVIQLRLPAAPRRRWLLGLSAGVLGLSALAYATVPNTFNAGDPLSSSKVNANFTQLDTRLAALEKPSTPNFIEQESDSKQTGSLGRPLVYTGVQLSLGPGTWLVNAFATVYSTVAPDGLVLGIYDATAGSEVAQSRGGVMDTRATDTTTWLQTSKVITLTATHTIEMIVIPNGRSTPNFGGAGTAVVLSGQQRMYAVQLH